MSSLSKSLSSQQSVLQTLAEIKPQSQFHKTVHSNFLYKMSRRLPSKYLVADSTKPWLLYWTLHSLNLLNDPLEMPQDFLKDCLKYIRAIECPTTKAYGGSIGKMPHTAVTYAVVCILLSIGTPEAYNLIDRQAVYRFFMSLKMPEGNFLVHTDGEGDVRGTYTVIATASMLNIIDDNLTDGVAQWVASCQTYEGGISGQPGEEAHGGYAYCGLATLIILGELDKIDMNALVDWLTKKQLVNEGGFQGRTNKLVDGCYSFWVGGALFLCQEYLKEKETIPDEKFGNPDELLRYIINYCQGDIGGLRDKPKIKTDLYHTCYVLSGMSVACLNSEKKENNNDLDLTEIDCVFNVIKEKITRAKMYFANK